ncbi:MAG: hypothetical protein ACFFD8_01075 [Candidatus Thorarchaeota archaeon]
MTNGEKIMKRWKKAFPLAGFKPALRKPTDDEYRLAQQFCPVLYADLSLIKEEQDDLARQLGLRGPPSGFLASIKDRIKSRDFAGITDALFLFSLGEFPDNLTGAKLAVLGVNLPESEIPWDKEMYRVLNQIRERLRKDYAQEFQDYIQSLFRAIFPFEETPTCVIKYRVSRDPADSNVYCIQYFAYWPLQLLPRHLYDYEPVYVIVRKEGKEFVPLIITFNADYGAKPLLKGKRPGHTIRSFLNWDSKDIQITPDDFNPMADYMTKAFGGSYHYKEVPSDRRISHINNLQSIDGPITLHIPKKWHSYDLSTAEIRRDKIALPCKLHPLKTQDLLHIEWNVRNPFQAPFLYPNVGKKNALMHFPLDAATLWQSETYRRWSDYALVEFHIKHGRPSQTVSNLYAYQVGLFIDVFSEISGESMGLSMWPLIEAREREIEETLSFIQRLRRPKN